jgi:hypothetical protein
MSINSGNRENKGRKIGQFLECVTFSGNRKKGGNDNKNDNIK